MFLILSQNTSVHAIIEHLFTSRDSLPGAHFFGAWAPTVGFSLFLNEFRTFLDKYATMLNLFSEGNLSLGIGLYV